MRRCCADNGAKPTHLLFILFRRAPRAVESNSNGSTDIIIHVDVRVDDHSDK